MKRLTGKMTNQRVAESKGTPFSANPMLVEKFQSIRSSLVFFILVLAFGILGLRAIWLQVLSKGFLQKQGEARYVRTLTLPATRGRILDRNGHVYAVSVPVHAVWASPEDVKKDLSEEKKEELSKLLGINKKELNKKLNSDKGFVYLKRQVDNNIAEDVAKLKINGIHLSREYKRYYPEGPTVAHVVGFTNVEDVGQESMELAHDKSLAGTVGMRRVIKDRLGQIVDDLNVSNEPRDGEDLVLSIDNRLQYIAYTQLKHTVDKFKAQAGGAVVLDVQTGEILALANIPSYDPNDRRSLSGRQLRNRVLTDTFEPGSTLKPFGVAVALEKGVVSPKTQIQTAPGKLTVGNATIGDAHPHGILSVEQIIEKSSNVGTAKIALKLRPEDMWEMFTRVGFGQATQLNFPGVAAGRVRPVKTWRPIEQATMSYGHGISTSLIQLAHAYMIFARDGDLIPLTLQKNDIRQEGQQIISPETAKAMRKMMEMAVGAGGTAPRARVLGYRVAGKTGTTKKIMGGNYIQRYVASFVGFAPVSNPRFIIAVMVAAPPVGGFYGGIVAAPIFSTLAAGVLRTMNIAPDLPEKDNSPKKVNVEKRV